LVRFIRYNLNLHVKGDVKVIRVTFCSTLCILLILLANEHVQISLNCSYTVILMFTCLAYTTNCAVYYVVPDDHYLDTSSDTNTLQYYVNHFRKYLLSNIQLLVLPVNHEFQTNLPVKDVYNLTLSGVKHKIQVFTALVMLI